MPPLARLAARAACIQSLSERLPTAEVIRLLREPTAALARPPRGRVILRRADDLLGAYERTFTPEERWGEGLHAEIPLETHPGAWVLSFAVELLP